MKLKDDDGLPSRMQRASKMLPASSASFRILERAHGSDRSVDPSFMSRWCRSSSMRSAKFNDRVQVD